VFHSRTPLQIIVGNPLRTREHSSPDSEKHTVPIHEHHRSATFPGFDPSVPRPARVYGYWLGGQDHYAADREAVPTIAYLEQQANR